MSACVRAALRRTRLFSFISFIAALIALAPVTIRAAEPFNNRGVVELETEGSAGASVRIAEDLASIVDDGATRRVVPVVGVSVRQNVVDLAMLRGIDMAILQADLVAGMRQQGAEITFTYIAKLYNKELHLLARPEIKSVADLAHRKVNLDLRGSGTSITAGRVFELLGVPVEPVDDAPELALDRLRRGEISAMALVAGKPASLFQGLPRETGLHFLAVPLDQRVINAYVPTSLTAADYPGLIADDQPVDTVAVGTLLAVARLSPGSERYRNVATFVDVFFTEFRALLEPGHHPKWHEINLAAEIAGLDRFAPAQAWLDRNAAVARPAPQNVKTLFSRFVDTRQQVIGTTPLSAQQKQELFDQFQRWQSGQGR